MAQQLHTVFSLIKKDSANHSTKNEAELSESDEEMKSVMCDDIPLLRKVSSTMEVDPYNRISA